MKYVIKNIQKLTCKTACPAVIPFHAKNVGFTLLELMVVIILVGILTGLAYSSLVELIQTNKAKEAARTMTTFVERAIAEGKMRKNEVEITITDNSINAEMVGSATPPISISEVLTNGFSFNVTDKPNDCGDADANISVTAKVKIGTSGITGPNCFVACNSGGNYCGAAVKTTEKNTFIAYIKKRSCNNSNCWEAL